jgi:hypothetical protein
LVKCSGTINDDHYAAYQSDPNQLSLENSSIINAVSGLKKKNKGLKLNKAGNLSDEAFLFW